MSAGRDVEQETRGCDGGEERDSVDRCGTACASGGLRHTAPRLMIEDGTVAPVAAPPKVPGGTAQGDGTCAGQKRAVSEVADTEGNPALGEGIDAARKRRRCDGGDESDVERTVVQMEVEPQGSDAVRSGTSCIISGHQGSTNLALGAGQDVTRTRQRCDGGDDRGSAHGHSTDCGGAGPQRAATWPLQPPQWLMIEDRSANTVAAPQVPGCVEEDALAAAPSVTRRRGNQNSRRRRRRKALGAVPNLP